PAAPIGAGGGCGSADRFGGLNAAVGRIECSGGRTHPDIHGSRLFRRARGRPAGRPGSHAAARLPGIRSAVERPAGSPRPHPERVRTLTAVSIPHPDPFQDAVRQDEDQRMRSAYMRTFRSSGAERILLADDARKLRGIYDNKVPAEHVTEYVRRLSEPGALT